MGLLDIMDQGLNLSDYQILDSEKAIGCPPLAIRLKVFETNLPIPWN